LSGDGEVGPKKLSGRGFYNGMSTGPFFGEIKRRALGRFPLGVGRKGGVQR